MERLLDRVRKGLRSLLEADVYLASIFEKGLLLPSWPPDEPQLFILGLPRTGTTLVYQYVVHRLRVAYFPNAVGRYYLAPCLATQIQKALRSDYRSNFRSEYGSVTGALAPHEAGRFWGRFFGFEDYVSPCDISPTDRRTLRQTVGYIQHLFGHSLFVNKNVKHILRIPALHSIFPNAHFLRVHRNWKDVGLSLLRARHANLPDPTMWWSAKPPNYRQLRDVPIVEQIPAQIEALSEKIDTELSALPSNKVLSINYSSFCRSPDKLIQSIRSRIHPAELRHSKVARFSPSTNTPTTETEKRLVAEIEKRQPT